jgi:hypothetical protein
MSDSIKIKPFWGNHPGEDPEEFADDIEFLAESWTPTDDAENTKLNKNTIRAFRQYLHEDGDAAHWWSFAMPSADKKIWKTVRQKFLDRYAVTDTVAADKFDITNEILSVSQGTDSIADYVKRIERLSKRVPDAEHGTLAFSFVKGMSDDKARRQVSFEMRNQKQITLPHVIELVKASFREIGAPDPFKLTDDRHARGHGRSYSANIPSTGGFFGGMGGQPIPVNALQGFPPVNAARPETASPSTAQEQGTAGTPVLVTMEQLQQLIRGAQLNQGFQMPASTVPTGTNPALGAMGPPARPTFQRRPSSAHITCFRCGASPPNGHYARECDPNTPALPSYEQHKLRSVVFDDMARRQQSVASGPNATPVNERPVTPGSRMVNHFRPVYVRDSRRINDAAALLATSIPVVRTIIEDVMAEKRAYVEDAADAQGRRPAKVQVRSRPLDFNELLNPVTEAMEATRQRAVPAEPTQSSERLAGWNKRPEGARPEYIPSTPADNPIGQYPDRPSEVKAPALGKEPLHPTSRFPDRPSEVNAPAPVKEPLRDPPIIMMRGRDRFELEHVLNAVEPRITFAQLLDCSPKLRSQLAHLLRCSITRARRKAKHEGVPRPTSVSHALPITVAGPEVDADCLYIGCEVEGTPVDNTLVDAGALLDLIHKRVIRRIGCETIPVHNFGMRMADDSVSSLTEAAWVRINVEGVVTRMKCYVVSADSVSYDLLLSKRWLKQMKAKEDHSTNTLYIQGVDAIWREVHGKPAPRTDMDLLDLSGDQRLTGVGRLSLETEECEDAVLTLLEELDNWDSEESGNGPRLS